MEKNFIPKATLERIPIYLRFLKENKEESKPTISATQIARGVMLGEVQVRKDLALTSGRGKPRAEQVAVAVFHNSRIGNILEQIGRQAECP